MLIYKFYLKICNSFDSYNAQWSGRRSGGRSGGRSGQWSTAARVDLPSATNGNLPSVTYCRPRSRLAAVSDFVIPLAGDFSLADSLAM